jgi:hypothetical protein
MSPSSTFNNPTVSDAAGVERYSTTPLIKDSSFKNEGYASGVSWPAVIGGAFVSAALALVLLSLGTGLGLSSVSPWSNTGVSASTIGWVAIAWLILIQIIASAMGGYLAGRLRTKWASIHTDEVYFRDTAHGFLVWAVALVITVYFLASAATTMVGGAAAGGAMATEAASHGSSNDYFVDSLFRSNGNPNPTGNDASQRAEVGRIFANGLRQQDLPAADRTYLGQLVAARTGLSQNEAEKRVSDVANNARQAADTARKATAHSLLWIFLALLIGAFCASYAATIGGRQRDHVKLI